MEWVKDLLPNILPKRKHFQIGFLMIQLKLWSGLRIFCLRSYQKEALPGTFSHDTAQIAEWVKDLLPKILPKRKHFQIGFLMIQLKLWSGLRIFCLRSYQKEALPDRFSRDTAQIVEWVKDLLPKILPKGSTSRYVFS